MKLKPKSYENQDINLSFKFENNSVVRSQLTQNEIDRLVTLGSVSSDWGESGQIRLKRKLQNT